LSRRTPSARRRYGLPQEARESRRIRKRKRRRRGTGEGGGGDGGKMSVLGREKKRNERIPHATSHATAVAAAVVVAPFESFMRFAPIGELFIRTERFAFLR
jgi:hypothetical protein